MNDVNKVLELVMGQPTVAAEELPEIELYVDQITTLLDGHFSDAKRNKKEKSLTKTMINNYSKEGLLKKIKGKKYSKQHIMMLILIYQLKKSLSIADIKEIFSAAEEKLGIEEEAGYDAQGVQDIYATYENMKEYIKKPLAQLVDDGAQEFALGAGSGEELLLSVLFLTNIAATMNATAQRLIDEYVQEQEEE